MANYLVVHDCRTAGVLGAAVFTRLVKSAGHAIESWFDPEVTGRTGRFWADGVTHLLERADSPGIELVLFGLTFNDRDPDTCLERIEELRRSFNSLTLWTHRFPDGYRSAGLDVRIPPDDLIYNDPSDENLKQIGRHLDGYDKRLLATSLLAAGAIARNGFEEEDGLAAQVDAGLERDVEATWNALVEGRVETIGRLQVAKNDESLASLIRTDRGYVAETNTVEVTIDSRSTPKVVPALSAHAKLHNVPTGTVYVCWVRKSETDVHERVVIRRSDDSHQFPALRWLVENRDQRLVPPSLRGRHFGPQDVLIYSVPERQSRASLSHEVGALAASLASHRTGGRMLTAALTRDVAAVGDEILQSLDLTKSYTGRANPAIRIAEESIYVLLHRSSRTNKHRATLTVPIEARGAKAVAFLFRENGYNLLKLERSLEGALVGLRHRSLTWLLPSDRDRADAHLPARVRLDVRPVRETREPRTEFAEGVRSALDADRMSAVDRSDGDVSEDSVIGRVLARARLEKLVCYNETETIGPSVAHTLALLSTASVAGDIRGQNPGQSGPRRTNVLDLFSGSGLANRLLTDEGHFVTSVDKFVPASAVGLGSGSDGLWLKADARQVLHESSPILDQRFDIIGLDPPHAELMDLLFAGSSGRSLVSACASRSNLLVLYQGHTTQSGRIGLLQAGLKAAGFQNVAVLQIDEELVVVAATEDLEVEMPFGRFIENVVSTLKLTIGRWGLERMGVLLERVTTREREV